MYIICFLHIINLIYDQCDKNFDCQYCCFFYIFFIIKIIQYQMSKKCIHTYFRYSLIHTVTTTNNIKQFSFLEAKFHFREGTFSL